MLLQMANLQQQLAASQALDLQSYGWYVWHEEYLENHKKMQMLRRCGARWMWSGLSRCWNQWLTLLEDTQDSEARARKLARQWGVYLVRTGWVRWKRQHTARRENQKFNLGSDQRMRHLSITRATKKWRGARAGHVHQVCGQSVGSSSRIESNMQCQACSSHAVPSMFFLCSAKHVLPMRCQASSSLVMSIASLQVGLTKTMLLHYHLGTLSRALERWVGQYRVWPQRRALLLRAITGLSAPLTIMQLSRWQATCRSNEDKYYLQGLKPVACLMCSNGVSLSTGFSVWRSVCAGMGQHQTAATNACHKVCTFFLMVLLRHVTFMSPSSLGSPRCAIIGGGCG